MRTGVVLLILAAASLATVGAAAGGDAGFEASDSGSAATAADGGAFPGDGASQPGDLDSSGDSGESGALVIACDGALCDTVQGRPTCDVASPGLAGTAAGRGMSGGLALALGLGLVRRAKRGT